MKNRKADISKIQENLVMESFQRRQNNSSSNESSDDVDTMIVNPASSTTSPEPLLEVIPRPANTEMPPPSATTREVMETVQADRSQLQTIDNASPSRSQVGPSTLGDIAAKLNITLEKDLPNQARTILFSEHSTPQNLNKLYAPIINPELISILPISVKRQDLHMFRHQQEIGVALSDMIKSLFPLTYSRQLVILNPINDACMLLYDVFNNETRMRRSLIINAVAEPIKNVISKTLPDKYLFGDNLADKLKVVQNKNWCQRSEELYKPLRMITNNGPHANKYKELMELYQKPLGRSASKLVLPLAFTAPALETSSSNVQGTLNNNIPPSVPIFNIQETKYAGRLKNFSQQWEAITQNSIAASWIKGYKIPFNRTPEQFQFSSNFSDSPRDFNTYLKKLVNIGAISICNHEEHNYVSSALFLSRFNYDRQFILNLKVLNQYILKPNFKYNDYHAVLQWIKPKYFMSIIDLKDAYFLLPVHEDFTKYLKFKINNVLYKFNCLIAGLSTARFVLATLIDLVMSYMELCNETVYVDDKLLCYGKTYEECYEKVLSIKKTLEELGFIIKPTNGLVPSTTIQVAGFVFNSVNISISLPDKKKNRIYNLLKMFLKSKTCTLREFTSLTSILTAAAVAVDYSWLYTKRLQRFKRSCLNRYLSYDHTINIPDDIRDDLKWWVLHVCTDHGNLKFDDHSLVIYSDASLTGWGAFCVRGEAFGHWKSNEPHSNKIHILELKAAFLALKAFAKNYYDTSIILKVDNTAAISCINKMGSDKDSNLDEISRQMWQWCEKRKLFIFAFHITSKKNIIADALSRMMFLDPEYELTDYAFMEITKKFGKPKIDIFASQSNAKCPEFVSRKNEPRSWAVDAFTVCWTNLNFYAFPPFYLISDMLNKIVSEKAEGIVVVPDWPKESWFPLFQKLKVPGSIIFESDNESGITPIRNHHNLNRSVRLIATKLSAKNLNGAKIYV